MKPLRVALSADTILYLPIYLLERDGAEIEIVQGSATSPRAGDQYAIDLIREGKADLCLCDPMVNIPDNGNSESIGKTIASIVTKVGLWGITTPFFKVAAPHRDIIDYVVNVPEVTIDTVLTYKSASSGRKAIQRLRSIHKDEFSKTTILHADFGTELSYLTTPYSDSETTDRFVDLIVTCDLVGVLAAEANEEQIRSRAEERLSKKEAQALRPPVVGVHFHKRADFSNWLFTALVAKRDLFKYDRSRLMPLLKAIQRKLDDFYDSTESELRSLASFLSSDARLFPSVGPQADATIQCSSESRQRYCLQALQYLKDNEILARTIRLDKSKWERAYTIWALDAQKSVTASGVYLGCVDSLIASEASPHGVRRAILSFWEHNKRHLLSIATSYSILATAYGLVSHALGSLKEATLFFALVFLGGLGISLFIGWLFRGMEMHEA